MNYWKLAAFILLVATAFTCGVIEYRNRVRQQDAERNAERESHDKGYAAGLEILEAFPVEDLLRMLDIMDSKFAPDAFARGMRAATRGRA